MLRLLPLLLLPLAACNGDDPDPDSDSDSDTGTDLDTEAPFACDALTVDAPLVDTTGRSLPTGTLSAALFAVSLGDDLVLPTEARWAGEATAEDGLFQLCVGRPANRDYLDQEPDAPLRIASFLVGAWADLDGDGFPGLGDPLVGAPATLLVHIDGTPPSDDEFFGDMETGWNTLTAVPTVGEWGMGLLVAVFGDNAPDRRKYLFH